MTLFGIFAIAGSQMVRCGTLSGQYWFDYSGEKHSFVPGNFDIPTDNLSDGLHTLHAYVERDSTLSSVSSAWFVKSASVLPGDELSATFLIDGKLHETIKSPVRGDGSMTFNLDLNSLPLGVHMLGAQIQTANGFPLGYKEDIFIRVPSAAQYSSLRGYYVIDGVIAGNLEAHPGVNTYHLDIDASELTSGIHSVSVFLACSLGIATTPQTAWFIKIPEGGEGVSSYRYWLNDDEKSASKVTLDRVVNPFKLIDLIEMPELPVCSSRYGFCLENGIPTVMARNTFNLATYDPDGRMTLGKSEFDDQRVKYAISEWGELNNNGKTIIPSINENEIKWFRFSAAEGVAVHLNLDRAATYDLYDPYGNLVVSVSGADAVARRFQALDKMGEYYLAVHDVKNADNKNVILEMQQISRHAFISHTPTKTANNPFIRIKVSGNGFNDLTKIALRGENVYYEPCDTMISDNYNLELGFDLDGKDFPIGEYHLVGTFYDKEKSESITVISESTLTVEKPMPVDIEVNIVDSYIAATPYISTVQVTNKSNVNCWCIPFNVAIEDNMRGDVTRFLDFRFKADSISMEYPPLIYTHDLLGTGKPGVIISAVIPYLAPGETRSYRVGFITSAHAKKTWYAWAGKPWSVEMDEIVADDYDLTQILESVQSNILSVRDIAHMHYVTMQALSQTSMQKAPNYNLQHSARFAKWTVGQALKTSVQGIRNPLETHREGALYFAEEGGGQQENVNEIAETDAAMLRVGEELVETANTGSDIRGFIGFFTGLLHAHREWQNSVPCNPKPEPHVTECYQSGDPNDMHGYVSPSGDNYIGAAVKSVEYTVEFENDPEIANASASVITVENKIDGKSLDLASFKPLKMIIGKKETELPAEHHFVKTLDMRPEINAIAELTFDYEAESGEARWALRSLDPMTMEPTRYMDDGILPVNDDSGRGTGYLSYSIDLRKGLADGTEIANSAVIVFDDNEPIPTPVWTNITDYTLPEAVIAGKELSEDGLSCTLTFEGSDSGSGIWYYDLYARAAGAERWELVRSQIEDDTFVYESATSLANTDFAVIATDRAGNRQSDAAINGLAGDADGNGVVNATDVVVTRNYYMDPTTQINLRNADVTVDGVVNAQDATVIRNVYLGEEVKRINNRKPTRRK